DAGRQRPQGTTAGPAEVLPWQLLPVVGGPAVAEAPRQQRAWCRSGGALRVRLLDAGLDRVRRDVARRPGFLPPRLRTGGLFRDALNRHGGDASVPAPAGGGLAGNTHFPCSDLNNLAIAYLLSAYLREKQLD